MANIAVNQDATSLVYLPNSVSQWTTLLSGTGIASPSSIWIASNASGSSLADSGTGGRTVTLHGSPTLGAAAPGWSATGIKCTDNSATQYADCTIPDIAGTSGMLLQCFGVNTSPSGARSLCALGTNNIAEARFAVGTSGPKLAGTSGANTSTGSVNYSAILVVVTKVDLAHTTLGVYARGEQIKPTWSAPLGSTQMKILGTSYANASDATLVYAAYWSGADAEISDALIQDLIDAVYGDSTTLSKMQAGSTSIKLVAAIEGCQYLLHESTADSAAVLSAWAGSDWTSTLGGLYVELKNSQSVTPWDPFVTGGSCTLRVVPDSADTFGVLVGKRQAGAETEITATIDRNDTTIAVGSTQDFTSSGTIYIGTEAIGYTGVGASSFTGCTRGKYSPFGCASSGSGGNRFGNHHRLGIDPNHVQMQPVATQSPRVWIGKRVGVYMHTYNASTGTLNSRDEAQLVYAGRIAGIADDPNTFATVLDIEPITEELRNGVIGKDMWKGDLSEGLDLVEGRQFSFTDSKGGIGTKTANVLTVKASGTATGTNEMDAGRYSLSELCEKLSSWLGAEKRAARIYGTYTWCSPVSSNVGLRTKCYWKIEDATDVTVFWHIDMPGEVAAFLGLRDQDPGAYPQVSSFGADGKTNTGYRKQGEAVPFTNLIFKPTGPGRISQEFSETMSYDVENEQGTFVDQYSRLPANIKTASDSTKQWGLFLLDEKTLMVGSYSSNTLQNCWLAPFQLTADNDKDSSGYIGRRADEPEAGPVTLRQIFVLEGPLSTLMAELIYGTGTSGYNHSSFDTLGYGLGIGIPGQMLGGSFERSLTNLPQGDMPIAVVIDEPTKFTDLFSADLVVRRSFIRWRDESFEFSQWKTPMTALALATLTESTKAAPAGQVENHRIASQETSEHARPIVKIDYSRDFAVGRDGQYLKSVQVEDQTAVDDLGGNVKPYTIKLRNVYHDLGNTGASMETLLKDFIAFMPVLARPFRMMTRSIDQRFWEGYGPGDCLLCVDLFARDPLTGRRGLTRAAMISRIAYDPGGPNPDGSVRPMGGEVDLFFLDVHRGELYAPSAQVDDTATNAGYNAATKTLTLYAHKFSNIVTITVNWGWGSKTSYIEESSDVSYFSATDRVLVCEIDPSNPASPTYWEDTIASKNDSANTITLTTGLAAPAWDATKKYRVTFQKYSQVTVLQQDYSFQADKTDMLVENLDPFFHFSITDEQYDYNAIDSTGLAGHLPALSYGDGRPWDVGNDRQLVFNLNEFICRKSGHQGPFLWNTIAQSGFSTGVGDWQVLFTGPIFLGTEHLNSTVTRTLTVAPFWRSNTAATNAYLRVTLSRTRPSNSPTVPLVVSSGYKNFIYTGEYSQSTTWNTTSTTWQTGADAVLSLGCKDIFFGYVWLTIEGAGAADCRGLAKCIEGVRTVA